MGQNAAQNERDTMKTFLLLAALAFVSLAGAADPNVAIVPSLVDEREAFFFSSTITLTLTSSTVVTSTCYSSTTACARRRRGIFADEVHESIQPSAVHSIEETAAPEQRQARAAQFYAPYLVQPTFGGYASYPAPFYGVAQPQPYAYAVKPSMYLPIDGERWLLTFSTVTNSYFFTTSLTSSCVPSGGATC